MKITPGDQTPGSVSLAEYVPLNQCSECRHDFTSTDYFDQHRIGVHAYTFSGGLLLDPPREDGRRCMDEDEILASGLRRVEPGDSIAYESRIKSGVPLYFDPVKAERARARFPAMGGRTDALAGVG